MNVYELMFLMPPESAETLVDEKVARNTELIQQAGGSVSEVTRLGRKSMAYAIENHREAIYTVMNFESDGTTNAEMERVMRLDQDILRFLTVRLDEEMRYHKKKLKEAEAALAKKSAKAPAPEAEAPAAPDTEPGETAPAES